MNSSKKSNDQWFKKDKYQWRIKFNIESPKQNLQVILSHKLNNPAHHHLVFSIVNVKSIQGVFRSIHLNSYQPSMIQSFSKNT